MCTITRTILLFFLSYVCASYGADFHDPHCNGKQVIVHLFEWKWTDIANECERYLGPKGFCAVQVSPPMEHTMITTDGNRPWWERYQPVSYKLVSRSGNEEQFKDMVTRCKNAGVRVIVDAVVNHMAGLGRSGTGTAGSQFNSDAHEFPGVPYTATNFHSRSDCPSGDGNVNNYGDPKNVRNCNLVGLTDLDGSQDYVQEKVSGYFNHLITIGVAGFRVDAAKHMWPNDIKGIQAKTINLPEGGRPFFAHEVVDRNDGAVKANDYFDLGYVTEFRYLQKVKEGSSDLGRLNAVYDPGWGMAPPEHAFVFVDNHDTQRGHESLTYKDGDAYKRAVAFTLANDYGFTRIMSSYFFTDSNAGPLDGGAYKRAVAFTLANDYGFTRIMSSYFFTDSNAGPPHNDDYSAKDVIIKADGSCDNGWVCEHRWKPIGNMAKFRNAVAGTKRENFKYNNGVMSFNRGNKGFFAMGINSFSITVNTGLPPGEYCDLISECATKVKVDGSGNAQMTPHDPAEPYVAIITEGGDHTQLPESTSGTHSPDVSPATQGPLVTQPTQAPWTPAVAGQYSRTIIIIQKPTNPGQDLFIRGGIDFSHRPGCSTTDITGACSIPIKHRSDGTSSNYDKVNAWSVGDNFLDWVGAEPRQGSYQGQTPSGTPAFWSTNVASDPGYSPLNKYGPHYWIVDLDMDCSKTEGSFFEFKAVVSGGWESNIQFATCTGAGAATPPYSSVNHFARCGYLNIFHFNQGTCEIETI